MADPLELIDKAIADLESRLSLQPGQDVEKKTNNNQKKQNNNKKKQSNANNKKQQPQAPPADQPDICKLEFKVGVITKVWNHPMADKLYCEEIDVGEESPRQIASGLRPHFTLEEM